MTTRLPLQRWSRDQHGSTWPVTYTGDNFALVVRSADVAELEAELAAWRERFKAITGDTEPAAAGNAVLTLQRVVAARGEEITTLRTSLREITEAAQAVLDRACNDDECSLCGDDTGCHDTLCPVPALSALLGREGKGPK